MANKAKPIRVLKRKGNDAENQEMLEMEWRRIGLTAPSREALVDAKLYKVSDMRKITLSELASLPGLGKSGVARIRLIMDAKKIKFRPEP